MNKLFLTLTFVLTTMFSLYSQSFEGIVKYKNEFLNPDTVSEAQILATQEGSNYCLLKYYFKTNHYKSESMCGNEETYQMYDPISKLVYNWEKGSSQVVTSSTAISTEEILGIEYLNEKETVLGIECNMLVITSNNETIKLWYNKDNLKMDASLYEGHKSGNLEYILQQVGCLPLKIEVKGNMLHTVQTVTEINPQTLNDSEFVLPSFSKIVSE